MGDQKFYKDFDSYSDSAKELIKRLGDTVSEDYYSSVKEKNISIDGIEEIKELLANPKFVKYNEVEDKFYYIGEGGEEEKEILMENYFNTFDGSNRWMSSRLIPLNNVFPNSTVEHLSNEQEAFYCCLVLAAIMGKSFKDEFVELIDKYNFSKWEGEIDIFGDEEKFTNLYDRWFSTSSKKVKMIFSAAKYTLSVQKNVASNIYASGVPREVALKLVKLRNEVTAIRLKYESGELSPISKEKLTKLEIKILYKEMEDKIDSTLRKDQKLFQLYKLFKIGGSEIPADAVNRMRRASRTQVKLDLQNGKFVDGIDGADLKEASEIYFKNLKKAYIAQFKADELIKYEKEGENYTAPDPQ